MGLFSYFKNALSEPQGQVYYMDQLEFDYREYKSHIEKSVEWLRKTLTDKRHPLMLKHYDGDGYVGDLLSRVKWTYMGNIMSWMEEEFIPKIGKYAKASSSARLWPKNITDIAGCYLGNGISHFEASKGHADGISAALHFFTCDSRSPFDMKASYKNGDCTPKEVCDWFVGGKHIVDNNIRRIEENITRFIEFARSNGGR